MLRKIILSLVVAVVVTLGCLLLGGLLVSAGGPSVLAVVGGFLHSYANLIGLLAGVWYFFAGPLV